MDTEALNKLRFPLGAFKKPEEITNFIIDEWIRVIETFPIELSDLVKKLNLKELHWRYRPEGWTIKQLVHHCADSHMNSFIRFKLALTESEPKIRPYFEDRWAELSDGTDDDITYSLHLISSLHFKWVKLLKSLTQSDLEKYFIHPEHNQRTRLDENLGIYAFHCEHHLEHIRLALKVKGKYND